MVRITKGQTVPLNVTQEARRRIFVGLGWDPNESISIKDRAMGALGLQHNHHDLDLSCYIYDANKRYISHVSTEDGRQTDQTGKIYHSGDNVEGIGEGDDEQISVELKDLDPAIQAIIFKASIKSGHSFDEITAPEIRLVDGYSNHDFLHVPINQPHNDKPAFIFASLIKTPDNQWNVRHIGEFVDGPDDGNWAEYLKTFVSA